MLNNTSSANRRSPQNHSDGFIIDAVDWIIYTYSWIKITFFSPKVSAIMDGSRELNRMRDEIKELPLLLLGLVHDEAKYRFTGYGYTDYPLWTSEEYSWQLEIDGAVIGATLRHNKKDLFIYMFADKQLKLDHEMIILVHSKLPGLIEGMQKHFNRLAPQ